MAGPGSHFGDRVLALGCGHLRPVLVRFSPCAPLRTGAKSADESRGRGAWSSAAALAVGPVHRTEIRAPSTSAVGGGPFLALLEVWLSVQPEVIHVQSTLPRGTLADPARDRVPRGVGALLRCRAVSVQRLLGLGWRSTACLEAQQCRLDVGTPFGPAGRLMVIGHGLWLRLAVRDGHATASSRRDLRPP